MMPIANHEPASGWRNFAAWGAMGGIFYVVAVLAGVSILHEDGAGAVLGAMLQSVRLAAALALGLVFAVAVNGFVSRRRPVTARALRSFAIRDVVIVAVFLLAIWGLQASARTGALGAMGVSEWVAAVAGTALLVLGLLGTLVLAGARMGAMVIDDEVAAEEMRERGQLFLYSFAWTAACGLLLIGLSLAGPGGILPPATALAGALALMGVLGSLTAAVWRLSDELARTLSHETGTMAFYLVLAVGGGWALLAHLGFAAAPAPLDWLTMLTMLLFVASVIALGRRGLLTR